MGISKIGPNKFRIKARVLIPSRDPLKQRDDRRKREIFEGTKAAAEARYLELRAELRGEKPQAKTFGDLLSAYLENRGPIHSGQRATYTTLQRDLGPVSLADLEDTLGRYLPLLRKTRSQTTGQALANGTINRLRTMTAAALNLAQARGVIKKNPLTKALWPKLEETPRDRFLDAQECDRLFATLAREAPHLLAMVQFAMLVPCRKSELVRMGRHDLDLFNNAIRVHNGTTKSGQGVWKPIPPPLVAYFRSIPPECPFLFFKMVKGQFRALGDFKKSWTRCLRLAGIADFHFHDSRHISATNMVNSGTPERVVMAVAGWSTNMLSTYWKNLGQGNLGLVRFPAGSGTGVATSEQGEIKSGESEKGRAVL